ncbi:MAG: hypothetical protein ACRDWD_04810 [Acidimicrobiia bacterium]
MIVRPVEQHVDITRRSCVSIIERLTSTRAVFVVAIAISFVVVAPLLAFVVTRVGTDYIPVQDSSLIELRVRDVWSGDLPLVGAYSDYGWNHPGPLMYWALAPLSFVTGGEAWATLVGAVALQLTAIVATTAVAWRRGRLPLVIGAAVAVALAYAAVGTRLLFTVWNPHVAFPFFPLLLLLIWSLCVQDRWQWVSAVVVGTFLVQTHLGYAPFVVVGLMYAAVFAVIDGNHANHRAQQPRW